MNLRVDEILIRVSHLDHRVTQDCGRFNNKEVLH